MRTIDRSNVESELCRPGPSGQIQSKHLESIVWFNAKRVVCGTAYKYDNSGTARLWVMTFVLALAFALATFITYVSVLVRRRVGSVCRLLALLLWWWLALYRQTSDISVSQSQNWLPHRSHRRYTRQHNPLQWRSVRQRSHRLWPSGGTSEIIRWYTQEDLQEGVKYRCFM